MSNRKAAEKAIDALRDEGRLTLADEGLVTAVLELSGAVDSQPANASLWREYRQMLAMLADLKGAGIDSFEAFLGELRATVGDGTES